MSYGRTLDPNKVISSQSKLRFSKREYVITPNVPINVAAGGARNFQVYMPKLATDAVIVPGSLYLSFKIVLTSTDAARSVVNNLGRNIIERFFVRLGGNNLIEFNNYDRYKCYQDLWLSSTERANMNDVGICSQNIHKLRLGATATSQEPDNSIKDAYGNKYYVPIDFEMFKHMPHYNTGLIEDLIFEIDFASAGKIMLTTDTAATYQLTDINLEYELVRDSELSQMIKNNYSLGYTLFYQIIFFVMMQQFDKATTSMNWNINAPAKSLRGLVVLFEDVANQPLFGRNPESFLNPKITNVDIVIEGSPNQIYLQGFKPFKSFDEARKMMAREDLKHADLLSITEGSFLNNMNALIIDFRKTDQQDLHSAGTQVVNGQQGITLLITRQNTGSGTVNAYIYMVMDGQLIISNCLYKYNIY